MPALTKLKFPPIIIKETTQLSLMKKAVPFCRTAVSEKRQSAGSNGFAFERKRQLAEEKAAKAMVCC